MVRLILKQMSRCVWDDELALLVIQRYMFRPVLDKLEGELVVATEVINWAVLLAETPGGVSALSTPEVVGQLQGIASKNTILQMRVLDMMVRVATLGQEHLQSVQNSGFLEQLIKILHKEDFLLKLNCGAVDHSCPCTSWPEVHGVSWSSHHHDFFAGGLS